MNNYMFGDKKNKIKDTERSLISETVSIEGTINSSGAIDIAGLIKGPVISKEVIVRETGSVTGTIEGDRVEIHGHMDGKISGDDVIVGSTGTVKGDIEFGNIEYLDYSKIGSGKSGLGILKSEISDEYKFIEGSVGLARSTEFDTEDSEFFITLKEIPIYQGEYTPIGKVIYGLDILRKIKIGNKGIYVLRPDYINTFRIFKSN